MELIPHNLNINFIGYRKYFIAGSIVVNLAVLLAAAIWSLNFGVDFAGGAEIEVKFDRDAHGDTVRQIMATAGFKDATVQVVGAAQEHSFLIHVGRIALLGPEGAVKAEQALKARFGADLSFDFNPELGDKIELRFKKLPPPPADEVKQALAGAGIAVSPDEGMRPVQGGYTVITSGIADHVKAALIDAAAKGTAPKSELRRIEFVGPQVGKQLRIRGILSVVYAAIAILVYVAFRFDTRFAPGAVIAMFHDIIVVLGYFVVSRREFNLTSVAVLLTIVGYSVNDTIVIYDRIRENLGKMKGLSLPQLINVSLNETLARTVLTSFATALSLVGLLIFGVGQIWDFAAAMMVGIVTGTYSSIYIASPVTIWLEELSGKNPNQAGAVKAKAV
jgi:preprotein translocase subunit SecF